jgi:hypothetical protein
MGMAEMKRQGISVGEEKIAEFIPTLSKTHRVGKKVVAKTDAELRHEAKRKLTYQMAQESAPKYSLYALRHSWATNALQRGVDALTVAILMGHKDPSQLAKVYQHLSHNPKAPAGAGKESGFVIIPMKHSPQFVPIAVGYFVASICPCHSKRSYRNEKAPHPCGAGTSHAACSGCFQIRHRMKLLFDLNMFQGF